MRLVPEMTPQHAFAQYKAYVESLKPQGIELDVRLIHSGEAIVVGTKNPYIQAATQALKEVWGKETRLRSRRRVDPHRGRLRAST